MTPDANTFGGDAAADPVTLGVLVRLQTGAPVGTAASAAGLGVMSGVDAAATLRTPADGVVPEGAAARAEDGVLVMSRGVPWLVFRSW